MWVTDTSLSLFSSKLAMPLLTVLTRNVPIGGVVMILIFFFLRMKRNGQREIGQTTKLGQKLKQLDIIGMTLIIASICCLLLAMQWGGEKLPWNSSKVIGLFVGSGLMLILFFIVQWRLGDDATLPLSILKQRSIFSGAWYLFFLAMPTYVVSVESYTIFAEKLIIIVRVLYTYLFSVHQRIQPLEEWCRIPCSRAASDRLDCCVRGPCVQVRVLCECRFK